ncbi:MAG: polysaccharide lyase 6 family protein [Paludibacter sp.]
MKKRINILIVCVLFSISFTQAKSIKVSNINQYNEKVKTLAPGDTIVLTNGVWQDAQLVLKGKGEEGKFICLQAETPGKVLLEGKSCLTLSGKWLHISGLVFSNGNTPRGAVIEFKTSSKEYAYNCVLSNCVIDKYNQPMKDSADHWIGMWGKKNKVEYCYFGGKTNLGTTLVVWPNDSNSTENNHLIYRNYFGPRARLGANGGETIRIGTSQVCTNSSQTYIMGNFFEHCNGEVEIISNKSCDNKIMNNTFWECEGSVVLRHGNRAVVSGNWFVGNGKENTGGVRVINEGHQIYNNFFYKLRGDDFRSSLALMNGIANSPANGYAPVKNVVVANNTYYDCAFPWGFCVGKGERNRDVTPEGVLLLNNLLYCPNNTELIKIFDRTNGIMQDNNLLMSANGLSTDKGTVPGEILKGKVLNFDMVYTSAKAKKLPFVKLDILGQARTESVVGAFLNDNEKSTIELATAKNCGPEWYIPTPNIVKTVKSTGKTIQVSAGTDLLYQTVKKSKSGDILVLDAGEHILTKKILIDKNIIIRSADAKIKPVLKMKADRANSSLFEIGGNGNLYLNGLAINGDSKAEFAAKYAFISSKEGALGYSLFVENCEIYDFNVETGAIFKAYKGSFADSIKISNSVLKDSYRGFSLGEEKDDTGKYNAENIIFDNTVFNNFKQYIVDYYRGGNDESTLGGSLNINHCIFNEAANTENQTILRLTGIVAVSIANSIFNNCMAKTSAKLSGAKNSIINCCFNNCPSPKVDNGAKSMNLIFSNPAFEKKSFLLSKKSSLTGKANDGGNVGLR